jgi:cytochrome c-type biogenesis protein
MTMAFLLAVDTARQVDAGSLVVAVPVAMLAGLVSFASPCVLPLVPGYLSFITGMSAADLAAHQTGSGSDTRKRRKGGRVLLGSLLFILGYSVLFMILGAAFGSLGNALREHQDGLTRTLGAVTIVFGLMFAGAFQKFRFANMELRVHQLPTAGLVGAPILGVLFGLGWTPCIGPTLSAVLGLAASTHQATAVRGAALAFAYCLGLGIPLIIVGLAFQRSMAALAIVKRHYRLVLMFGGGLLITIGVLEVTGIWGQLVQHLQTAIPATSLL